MADGKVHVLYADKRILQVVESVVVEKKEDQE